MKRPQLMREIQLADQRLRLHQEQLQQAKRDVSAALSEMNPYWLIGGALLAGALVDRIGFIKTYALSATGIQAISTVF